jgi:HrpA-like RNA helicase
MNTSRNYNYSTKIKSEPEQYDYQREIPLKEENKNNKQSSYGNKYQNNNKNNHNNFKNNNNNKPNFNNQNPGSNKFLGIKREKFEEERQYNSYANNNKINKNYNYSKNIKREKEDKYLKPRNNANFNNQRYNYRNFGVKNNNNWNNKVPYDRFGKKELPIFSVKDLILNSINSSRITIISGNTGCGKSTQVPQYIYGLNCENKILMTQPRRIAAVSIARRLAQEMHEKVGGKIGYHVSMNPRISSETKIFVKTTGIFMEELIHRSLDYTHIIIDEVHERDIYVDLVLALIKYHFEQDKNSKIKVIVRSATIADNDFAIYL